MNISSTAALPQPRRKPGLAGMIRPFLLGLIFMGSALGAPMLCVSAHASGKGGGEAEGKVADSNLTIAGVVAPVTRDGQLVNYIFLTLQLEFAPGVSQDKLRANAHVMRDAILIALHQTDVSAADSATRVDDKRANAVILAALNESLGGPLIKSVQITSADSRKRVVGRPLTR